jgi:Flp pilus assembly protein TadG
LTVEFALLVPALVLLFGVVVGGARVWMARTTVENAAGAAARAAVLERSAADAARSAERLAATQATTSGLRCDRLHVSLDSSAFARPVGTPGTVTASVTCQVPLGDVLVPGWPGSVPVSATASAPLDSFRGRK